MKILFSSSLGASWMSGWQRAQVLKELGHEVVAFAHDPYERRSFRQKLVGRLIKEPIPPEAISRFNRDFLEAVRTAQPSLVWADKALMLTAETLKAVRKVAPSARLVCFQDDDPFGYRQSERPLWRNFVEAIPDYDIHFVKKDIDLKEFAEAGAKRVELFVSGFFSEIFRPLNTNLVSGRFRHQVTFVGTALDHRVEDITRLIQDHQLPVNVYGNLWRKHIVYWRNRALFGPAVMNEDYVSVICGSKISLGFVSSSNRDQYTMRTFEIPACGGFFLGERTTKHQEFFEEGKEVELFSSLEECAEKAKFYLKNESPRLKIAQAGYQRCIRSDYSLKRRMKDAISFVLQ